MKAVTTPSTLDVVSSSPSDRVTLIDWLLLPGVARWQGDGRSDPSPPSLSPSPPEKMVLTAKLCPRQLCAKSDQSVCISDHAHFCWSGKLITMCHPNLMCTRRFQSLPLIRSAFFYAIQPRVPSTSRQQLLLWLIYCCSSLDRSQDLRLFKGLGRTGRAQDFWLVETQPTLLWQMIREK